MLELSREQIKTIAEELDTGLEVYVNIKSGEIITMLESSDDFMFDDEVLEDEMQDDGMLADTDPWAAERKEISKNPDSFFQFEKMESKDSFHVMRAFVETVTDKELKMKLELGLSLSKPFRNFKDIIDMEGDERKRWFAFKQSMYEEFVEEQIEMHNNYLKEDF